MHPVEVVAGTAEAAAVARPVVAYLQAALPALPVTFRPRRVAGTETGTGRLGGVLTSV